MASSRVIVVTSGKGGVGKTTAAASISAALAINGFRVVVMDLDIGLRNLDVVMGLENRIIYNIVDVVQGKCDLKQACIKDRRIENLYLIPASQSDNKDVLKPDDIITLTEQLKYEFDYVIIDCPAGIEQGFENAIAPADEAIVLCTPEVSSIRDADRIIGILHSKSIESKLIINRIIPRLVKSGDMLSHEDVTDVLSIELIGLVEMDDKVVVATNTGKPLVLDKESIAGYAFKRIARRIVGDSDVPVEIPEYNVDLWSKIGKKFGFGK
ncbi:MAG: septum site-determining protein MinD [Desulfobacterales bacterium]|nr:septum site-determining protein MinD [Desulfobacterales bacterium]MCP4159535.1 septum site-determining protein MinD [Deltaproteobacteria bacterium]